jgi:hypothetical protein
MMFFKEKKKKDEGKDICKKIDAAEAKINKLIDMYRKKLEAEKKMEQASESP